MAKEPQQTDSRRMLMELRTLQMQAEDGERQLAVLQDMAEQTTATISALENLPLATGALFSAGSGVLVKASADDSKNVLVEVGGGVVMEKSVPDAVAFLQQRLGQAVAASGKIRERNSALSGRIEELSAFLQQAGSQ
ncbi:prefoldin subunit alpha [Candidatus Micrarchaeota archaeon]|nr:prefoldin subunit alpha [Candidatus Micrarchaeota archaeon]MBI5177540.1 prefoldin subunit alpha [Candidatus Micrarchaeota archaeon]